jgi:DNA repair protein RecO (recombination protein O)
MGGRSYTTEAVVLRSLRFSEADRILHLYTLERGRVGAIAKGVRKTKSRFGARLEPLSHAALQLHEGSGELQTVTGADLVRPHQAVREDAHRLAVGQIGAEAMLRLFVEPEPNPRAFAALTRFLDLLDEPLPEAAPGAPTPRPRPAHDPLGLSFQLKLLWLSGYLPHVTTCVECGGERDLVGFSARAGGAVCRAHARDSFGVSPGGLAGIERLLSTPLADARSAGLPERAAREALAVVVASYEEHGSFRLRTLSA